MNLHLKDFEIVDYLKNGEHSFSGAQKDHLAGCAFCRKKIEQQAGIDGYLKKLMPMSAPGHLIEQVTKNIGKIADKPKTDWVFVFALLSLLLIAVSIVLSGGLDYLSPAKSDSPVELFTVEKIRQINLIMASDVNEAGQYWLQKILGSKLIITMLISMIAFMFYYLIDRYYGRRIFH